MKIALIYEFLSELGGLERLMISHAKFLKEMGHNVEIVTCHLDKKILKLLPFGNIKIKEVSRIKTPLETLNLVLCFLGLNKIKELNYDLFISYSAPCNFLIRNKKAKKINYINHYPHFLYLPLREKIEWASSTQGIKRQISVVLSLFFGNYLKKIDKDLLKRNKLNIVNSKFTKKKLEKIYSLFFKLSYPPVDPIFKPARTKIKEKFIFSSSRIIPDKKYEWIIEAIGKMKQKMPFYVSGAAQEQYKKRLIECASKNKVTIKFLGKLDTDSLIKYYNAAQVFAFPAPLEDFGLVPAESLSCGTPVIAWGDGAGPCEQVTDGINGYLAKPYDTNDFAEKLDLCIKNDLKNKNYEKIISSAKRFSFDNIKKDFILMVTNALEN